MPSSTRRSRRPPSRRVRFLLFLNWRLRSSASGGAAAARNPTPAAASRPKRGSRSTTAGRASTNCRRSRPRSRSTPRARSSPATTSPDIGFDRSINPYRGCEHGCVYCFARPTHAYLGLSPGLDFESKLFAKPDAPQLLEKELAAQDYEPRMIAIGTNTDPYQPIERERKIMRGILEVLERAGHPVGIVTKSALVTRDIDILSRMAKRNLAKVALSVTTLDPKLARTMEPRASTPPKRLEALRQLSEAGIPTTVMVAPVIPALNDSEIERILDAAAHAGVKEASYVLLRLPLEVRDLFREWLMANYPDRYRHVFTLIRDMRGGRDYDSQWGTRMKGTGPMAWMIGRRFEIACEKLGLNKRRSKLTTDHFARPKRSGQQLSLF